MKKLTVVLFFPLVLISCVDDHGNRVEGGELTVYFDRDQDLQKATQVASFWKNNDLLTGAKQDLKLTYSDSTYYLHLIKRNELELGPLDIREKKMLLEFQKQIEDSLFKDGSLEIVITDEHFKPLMNIND